MNIIGETIVGSHVWKMNHKDSDVDIFQVYVEPTRRTLDATASKRSLFIQKDNHDYAIHEAEQVVEQLLKGNINFIVGILSPEINVTSDPFNELRKITETNLSKNCFESIKGMAMHNQLKFEKAGKMTEKKWNQLIRILDFGIRILDGKGAKFEPVSGGFKGIFEVRLAHLQTAYDKSHLPEKPKADPFRDWLYNLRLTYMEKQQ